MNPGLHPHPPSRGTTSKRNPPPQGFAHALRQQVQELRSKLGQENHQLLQDCGERRKTRLQTLMQELHQELLSEFRRVWQQSELARATARQAECADRSAQVAQSLQRSQELRQSMASAEKSHRRAEALHRSGRLAELREQTHTLLSAARQQQQANSAAAEASAEHDRNKRASFMQSMREQVTAMADAFQAEHKAHCAESKHQRAAVLWGIYDFVTTLTGRPHASSKPTPETDPAPSDPSESSEDRAASAITAPPPPAMDDESADEPPISSAAKREEPRKRSRSARSKARA